MPIINPLAPKALAHKFYVNGVRVRRIFINGVEATSSYTRGLLTFLRSIVWDSKTVRSPEVPPITSDIPRAFGLRGVNTTIYFQFQHWAGSVWEEAIGGIAFDLASGNFSGHSVVVSDGTEYGEKAILYGLYASGKGIRCRTLRKYNGNVEFESYSPYIYYSELSGWENKTVTTAHDTYNLGAMALIGSGHTLSIKITDKDSNTAVSPAIILDQAKV